MTLSAILTCLSPRFLIRKIDHSTVSWVWHFIEILYVSDTVQSLSGLLNMKLFIHVAINGRISFWQLNNTPLYIYIHIFFNHSTTEGHLELIFDKSVKAIRWGKETVFNKWCWENRISTYKRMKLYSYLTPHWKINSKWIKDLKIRAKAIKLLSRKHGSKFSWPWIWQRILS